ncbi:hypothetical protein Tco_0558227 [Tanacetum coccineum]
MVPRAVLMKTGLKTVNNEKGLVYIVRARGFNAVKPSACWVWKPSYNLMEITRANHKAIMDKVYKEFLSLAHLLKIKIGFAMPIGSTETGNASLYQVKSDQICPEIEKVQLLRCEVAFSTSKDLKMPLVQLEMMLMLKLMNIFIDLMMDSPLELVAYTDSDSCFELHKNRIQTDVVSFLGNRNDLWQCKKQYVVCTYFNEAEYVAAAKLCGQVETAFNNTQDFILLYHSLHYHESGYNMKRPHKGLEHGGCFEETRTTRVLHLLKLFSGSEARVLIKTGKAWRKARVVLQMMERSEKGVMKLVCWCKEMYASEEAQIVCKLRVNINIVDKTVYVYTQDGVREKRQERLSGKAIMIESDPKKKSKKEP